MKKFYKILTIFIAAGLFSVSPLVLFAVDPITTSGVTVSVKNDAGEPATGVNLQLNGPSSYSTAKDTDSSGIASFTTLAAGDYTLIINLTEADLYVLKTGEQASKSFTLSEDETKNLTFLVTNKPDNGSQDETTPDGTMTMPSVFTQTGSSTTNLTKLTDTQLKAVKNFTLHIPGFAKIVFKEPVDFSTTKDQISQLDQFVFLQQPGQVSIATELAPQLDKPAAVTLYGLNYNPIGNNYTPLIIKDDQEPVGSEVTNITLSGSGTITFNVSGFTTYSLKPILFFDKTEITSDTKEYTLKGSVDDLDSKISIILNDTKLNQVIAVGSDGTFSAKLSLKGGDNKVQVEAVGISEQKTTTNLTVKYPAGANNNVSSDITLIIGIILVLGGVSAGGIYLYKTKYLDKRNKSPKGLNLKRLESYDSRLLTPEERMTFNNEKSDNAQDRTV